MDSPPLKATRSSSIAGVFRVIFMRTPQRYASKISCYYLIY